MIEKINSTGMTSMKTFVNDCTSKQNEYKPPDPCWSLPLQDRSGGRNDATTFFLLATIMFFLAYSSPIYASEPIHHDLTVSVSPAEHRLTATDTITVDIVLALILVVGGVVGAQFGVRAGARLRAEELRTALALLIIAIAIRLLFELVLTPSDLYSVITSFG